MAVFFFLKKVSVFGCATEEGRRKTERDRKRESGARGLLACRAVTGGHKTRIEGISRLIQVHSEHENEASPGDDFMSILFLTVVLSLSSETGSGSKLTRNERLQ